MTTNISEFERTKPNETFKVLNNTREKYKKLIRPDSEITCIHDEVKNSIYLEILSDLNQIKYYFLKGK